MTLDEQLWRLSDALNRGQLTDWEQRFAKSLLRQSKRTTWEPSDRQLATIRRIIRDLRSVRVPITGLLIDREDSGAVASG